MEPLTETIGQPRALDAIRLGLEIDAAGYNMFVTGLPGSGREAMVRDHLAGVASSTAPADDWVYVEDFSNPDRPHAIRLPAGRGTALASEMDGFLAAAARAIRSTFESDQYADQRRKVASGFARRRDALLDELKRFAAERGFAAESTMTGIVTVPLLDGQPVDAERFVLLPASAQQELQRHGEEIQVRVAEVAVKLRQIEKELERHARELDRRVADFAVTPLVHDLRQHFADLPCVREHIDAAREELLDHVDEIRGTEPSELPAALAALSRSSNAGRLDMFRVNVLVDNGGVPGVPIVVERNPTYYNLMGRIDYRTAFGTLVTDLQHIKAGALHRANGGFLVLHAADVLQAPFSWEALKRALTNRAVRLENLAAQYSAVPTVTLSPEPIPLDLKVIMIGTPLLYRLLCQIDEDFRVLFKVKVDFAPDMEWTGETALGYARLIARLVGDRGLRHFSRSAVARVIEHGSRMRDDQRKLSTRMGDIADVVTEASYWAGKRGRRLVAAADVSTAIAERERRSNIVEERSRELQTRGSLRIETGGEQVGQVNGVAVIDLGDHAFGRPCRITARTALGGGGVHSIERESKLSGPLHSKGVLILAGYLSATYAQEWPLALTATITFEQSYDEVEGDSASCSELCALLSALSGAAIRQGVGITGSVDQHGGMQAVGGVTTKVEGFFHACRDRGLTGSQGMILPEANTSSLMLSDEVIDAVRAHRFNIWAVRTVDQAMEILTGDRAGTRRRDGSVAFGTIHGCAEARLRGYAERIREFGGAHAEPASHNGAAR